LVCEFCFARAAHQSRCLTCEEAAS
jgi:hypothetical protein